MSIQVSLVLEHMGNSLTEASRVVPVLGHVGQIIAHDWPNQIPRHVVISLALAKLSQRMRTERLT
jgi:hypothetical protein